ncbi:MAG: COX15/CtaA family protein [Ignavibacteria bacterium]|nr:COX15/CtaA family protein [Ignavibacteria bacterium]
MTFYRLALATLLLVFCVVLAGGIVRTTGSGMGCPDWPKCFGRYIPPTDISQLPPDYKTAFAVQGKQIADFDAFKTWVEYINRLLGALLGIVILILVVESRKIWKHDKWLPVLSVLLLIVTGFVGWLGSVVVATDLEPVKITIHMMTSVVIIFLATVVVFRASRINDQQRIEQNNSPQLVLGQKRLQLLIVAALLLTLSQIIMGTQVREQVDMIAKMLEGRWREQWIEQLSMVFVVHRSASWLFVLLNGAIIWYIARMVNVSEDSLSLRLRRLSMGLMTLIVGEIVLGILMAYFAIPKFAQPLHLLFAMGIFCLQSFLLLTTMHGKQKKQSV